mgnify:CR=1 FL=1|tara:strand:+ start:719 stop:1195 length:477 start_codon:yes stop_codon:yes gene_type:complete
MRGGSITSFRAPGYQNSFRLGSFGNKSEMDFISANFLETHDDSFGEGMLVGEEARRAGPEVSLECKIDTRVKPLEATRADSPFSAGNSRKKESSKSGNREKESKKKEISDTVQLPPPKVFCLLSVGCNVVWVGMGDGTIQVWEFTKSTCVMVQQIKVC